MSTLRRSATLLVLIIVACTSLAQQKPTPTPVSVDQEWEYIVVSYGKTEFGGPEKTLAYRPIGLPNGHEAQELQRNLDILGRFGWEAIAFVGAVGGDQQIVLKRKYDKNRIVSEREAISLGAQLYIKDMADILEREQSLREAARRAEEAARRAEEEERNKPHLIDLDVKDAEAAKAARRVALRNSYIEAFKSTFRNGELSQTSTNTFKNSELSQTSTITIEYSNEWSDDIDVEIRTDLTKRCLKDDGKSYRRGEAYQYMKNSVVWHRFPGPLQRGANDVRITAIGFIQFDGNPVEVVRYETRYSFISGQWTD